MIRGIHHIAVHVHDLERMTRFYRNAFGFTCFSDPYRWQQDANFDAAVNLHNTAGRCCLLRSGNCYMELFEYAQPAPDSRHPKGPHDKGYTHFCVDVVGIEGEMERLRVLGMSFGQPQPVNMGPVKSIYGRDPEGNIIELQETLEQGFELEDLPSLKQKPVRRL